MSFLNEVKRRNVHRMAVLYVLTTWVIMQAAEVVMTLAALPDWTGRVTLMLLALGFPIALVLSWFYELTPEGVSLEKDIKVANSVSRETGRHLDFVVIAMLCATVLLFAFDKWRTGGPPILSIAVLPLDDYSTDEQLPGFADGLTDLLTAELGQIRDLRVISRTSAMQYRGTGKSLPQIADELKVDAIVEGSIQAVGDDIRFTLQLIDGRTDRHLWARSYHREFKDALTLQGKIAQAIADEIRITLTPQTIARLARDRTTNGEALMLWAIGNKHLKGLNESSFNKALQAFTEASRIDPGFANAYAGIAWSHLMLGSWHASEPTRSILPLAKVATDKALQLDPGLAEAHLVLAKIHEYEWNWEAAEREFRKSAALNRNNSLILLEYANFLNFTGRIDKAIEISTLAIELDPLLPQAYNELAWAYVSVGRNDDALAQYQRALRLDPNFGQTHILLVSLYLEAGEYDSAMKCLQKYVEDLESVTPLDLGLLAASHAQMGQRDEALKILALLKERKNTQYVPAVAFAQIYLALEELDKAIPWLEAAYDERDLMLVWVLHPMRLDAGSFDPRIITIRNNMDLPEPSAQQQQVE